jgi:hypothetical protein
MIVNVMVVVYSLIAALALAVVVPAAAVGTRVAWRWRNATGIEERADLEKRIYLVITLMAVGLSLRLVLVPLWFLTLQSLVSHVPGAMCLAGVHMLDAPWSFVATVLKIVVPLAYGYWLVLNLLDRRVARQPLLGHKLLLLIPIAALVVIESGLDFHFIASVEPRTVSCCSSLFDRPVTDLGRAVSSNDPFWVWGFAGLAAATIGLSAVVARRQALRWRVLLVMAAVGAMVTFPLALHSRLSSLLLHTPRHHCVFCVLQMSADVAVACGLVVCGAWLAVVAGILPSRVPARIYRTLLGRLLRVSVVLLGGGILVLALRTFLEVLG